MILFFGGLMRHWSKVWKMIGPIANFESIVTIYICINMVK